MQYGDKSSDTMFLTWTHRLGFANISERRKYNSGVLITIHEYYGSLYFVFVCLFTSRTWLIWMWGRMDITGHCCTRPTLNCPLVFFILPAQPVLRIVRVVSISSVHRRQRLLIVQPASVYLFTLSGGRRDCETVRGGSWKQNGCCDSILFLNLSLCIRHLLLLSYWSNWYL